MRTKVTSDAGLLAYRDLDKALGLFDRVPSVVQDLRTGRNIQHDLPALLRQSVYSRLAGYEDVNDAHRLNAEIDGVPLVLSSISELGRTCSRNQRASLSGITAPSSWSTRATSTRSKF